jgi:ABC-2 type transport system ATP-binding protein
MEYVFDNERPIYIQLVEMIRIDIISGKFKSGQKLPSVRELALTMKVNPNTIQKALAQLEEENLIYTERTNGKYVTENDRLIETIKKQLAQEKVNNYLNSMEKIGINNELAAKYLQELGGKMELVECNNLCKEFDNKQILKNINLTIPTGKIVGLLGKNGMGKTTLIKLINDLLTPTSGEVLVNGEKPNVNSKKIISYLPERTYLDKSMKVSQILTIFEEFYDNFNKEKVIKLLKDLDLDINLRVSKMSKGMQEKLQLILVMSRDAKLYILDEPLGGVDPATRDYILDTILSNFSDGASVIISTHLISDIERILDEVIFIDNGEIVLTSPADELRNSEKASIDEIFRRRFKC